jgi:hypothetical protein
LARRRHLSSDHGRRDAATTRGNKRRARKHVRQRRTAWRPWWRGDWLLDVGGMLGASGKACRGGHGRP